MASDQRSTGAPRWPVLWALVVGVLVAHLWLVGGGLPAAWFTGPQYPAAGGALPPTPPTDASTAATARPTTRLPAVTVSRVRWIAPPPPQAPPPTVAAAPKPAVPSRPRSARAPQPPAAPAAVIEEPPQDPPPTDEASATATSPAEPPPDPQATPTEAPPPTDTVATAPVLPAATTEATPAVAAAPDGTATTATTPAIAAPAAASPPAPAQAPPSIALDYDLHGQSKGLNYSADAQLQWENDGQRYRARLTHSAFLLGSRIQSSEGSVGPNGLAPERYGDQRRRSERATHFDAASGRIRFSNNAPDAAWVPGAQDRLSMFLQLAALFQAQPAAYPPGSRITLLVAGTGSAALWTFEVGSPETLSLPAGEISTVRLLRPPRHSYDIAVDIWLAPALQHLPVRIRLTEENGSYADQQLRQMPPVIQ